MSRRCIYDNWEKLVSAVVKKQQLWELFHQQSRSPSLSSDSSGSAGSFTFNQDDDNFDFTFSTLQQDDTAPNTTSSTSQITTDSYVPGASPSTVSTVLPVPVLKRNSSIRSRKSCSSLVIQVPKLTLRPWDAFDRAATSKLSPLPSPPPTTSNQGAGHHDQPHNTNIKWPNDTKHLCHPLPLPPSSKTPSPTSVLSPPGSPWKKGKLLEKGPLGSVYVGFNSETGEMCAMKEVILHPDDAESKRSAEQLKREIAMLSSLRHPNIVQYYGSEMVDEKLCIYSEYVSDGSVHKILQDYGRLGESAIRSYTQQMLSGLAYLHSTGTIHRDIKGATVLVDPNGSIKLSGFGTSKHTLRRFNLLALEGLPYWLAPEMIRYSNECNPAVDIWSLGCTVLEMASAKPPWSQYGEAVALFKIGCTKERPTIPDHLSGDGKEFVGLCLQRNPHHRPTAAQLLEHPFLKSTTISTTPTTYWGIDQERNTHQLISDRHGTPTSRVSHPNTHSSNINVYTPRKLSRPVSPVVPDQESSQHRDVKILPQQPISNQSTRSNLSTAVTGGIGANTYHHLNQSTMQRYLDVPRCQPGPRRNAPSYWDPEIIQAKMSHFSGSG